MRANSSDYDQNMTDPTQPGPYHGQPTVPPQPVAPAPGWPTATPQQGSYPYGGAPAGYSRPPRPPADAAVLDRVSGGLLILAAALAIGGSFAVLDTSDDSITGGKTQDHYTSVAKAWSYSSGTGSSTTSVTQFFGVPLLIGSVCAIVVAVLLLAGLGRRLTVVRVLGVASAGLLFGATLTVATSSVNDSQWDTSTRNTDFGPGFWLVTLACLVTLAAAVPAVLGIRLPADAAPPGRIESRGPHYWPPAFGQPQPAQPAPPQYPPPPSGPQTAPTTLDDPPPSAG